MGKRDQTPSIARGQNNSIFDHNPLPVLATGLIDLLLRPGLWDASRTQSGYHAAQSSCKMQPWCCTSSFSGIGSAAGQSIPANAGPNRRRLRSRAAPCTSSSRTPCCAGAETYSACTGNVGRGKGNGCRAALRKPAASFNNWRVRTACGARSAFVRYMQKPTAVTEE